MKRRDFLLYSGYGLGFYLFNQKKNWLQSDNISLPDPVYHKDIGINLVLNSRYSVHGAYQSGECWQEMANVLWAIGRLPWGKEQDKIYAGDEKNVYIYDAVTHSLKIYLEGDYRTETNASFQLVVLGSAFFSGASHNLGLLAGCGFWEYLRESYALAFCPYGDELSYEVTEKWQLPERAKFVTCYGKYNIKGLDDTCVAHSSDESLPDPETSGGMVLEEAFEKIAKAYTNKFLEQSLSIEQLSQILWSGYGVVNHYSFSGNAAVSIASKHAEYYMTTFIYGVSVNGFYQFYCRPADLDFKKRDHRLILLKGGDYKTTLLEILPELPEKADFYILLALPSMYSEMASVQYEAGAFGGNVLLQCVSLGLGGHFLTDLSNEEKSKISEKFGFDKNTIPYAVISIGYKDDTGFDEEQPRFSLRPGIEVFPNPFKERLTIMLEERGEIYNITGQRICKLTKGKHLIDTVRWKAGVYFIKSGSARKKIIKLQ